MRTRAARALENATADAPVDERIPLGEVAVNAADLLPPETEQAKSMPPKRTKSKRGKKGVKGVKGVKGAQPDRATAAEEEEEADAAQVVLEDERQAAGSPASEAAAEDLAGEPTDDVVQIPMRDRRPSSPPGPSRAVRLTRRQLVMQEEDMANSQQMEAPPDAPEIGVEEEAGVTDTVGEQTQPEVVEDAIQPRENAAEPHEEPAATGQEVSPSPDAAAVKSEPDNDDAAAIEPKEVSSPEPKSLTSEKPCESGRASPSSSRTPSPRSSKSPAKSLEESIEAIDALEEALENVIPKFNPATTEKEQSPCEAESGPAVQSEADAAAAVKVPANPSVLSKNPTVPRSMKAPPRSKPSIATASRTSIAPSSRSSVAPGAKLSIARSSSVRASSAKDQRKAPAEVTDYLASKRRPISISFPTPPPPPKASKPPTRSNFQLPGEAVAARLKAAKEERLKREQEGGQRPVSATYKGPVVKSSKPPTKSSFQLPGEAVAAKLKAQKEERLAREAQGITERPASTTTSRRPAPPKSSKPPTIPSFQLPGDAVAAKLKAQREERLKREQEEAAKKATFKARPAPVHKAAPAAVRQTAASKARESLMAGGGKKENGGTNATTKRVSSAPSHPASNKRASVIQPKATGREVFNRDKMDNEQRLKEKREKEEAAKKARAEAAERGRIASREWAEKQRRKVAAAKTEAKAEVEPETAG